MSGGEMVALRVRLFGALPGHSLRAAPGAGEDRSLP